MALKNYVFLLPQCASNIYLYLDILHLFVPLLLEWEKFSNQSTSNFYFSSNPVNDGNTQRFSTYTNYSNYPCSSVSPGDSVSQAGQKPIQEAGGSGVYQKVCVLFIFFPFFNSLRNPPFKQITNIYVLNIRHSHIMTLSSRGILFLC